MNGGSLSLRGLDLERASEQLDSLLHAQQAYAFSLSGSSARGSDIKTNAVILNDQLYLGFTLKQFYPHLARFAITNYVGQRFLGHAETSVSHLRGHSAGGGLRDHLHLEAGPFRLALQIPA